MDIRTLLLVAIVALIAVAMATGAVETDLDQLPGVSSEPTPVPDAGSGSSAAERGTVSYHGDFLEGKFENILKGELKQMASGQVGRGSSLDEIAEGIATRMARDRTTSASLEGVTAQAEAANCLTPQVQQASLDIGGVPNDENAFSDAVASQLSVPDDTSRIGIGSEIGSDGHLYVATVNC